MPRVARLPDEVSGDDPPRHVPTWGAHINKDTKNFIRYFLPKGVPLTRASASKAVRHMHLAFKGKATTEIYDILMEQLLRAIQNTIRPTPIR